MNPFSPIITSRVGGNEEMIEHNRQGYLVQVGCEKELATALNELIAVPNLRKDFGWVS